MTPTARKCRGRVCILVFVAEFVLEFPPTSGPHNICSLLAFEMLRECLNCVDIKPRIAVDGIILNHPGDDGLVCCKHRKIVVSVRVREPCPAGRQAPSDVYPIRVAIDWQGRGRGITPPGGAPELVFYNRPSSPARNRFQPVRAASAAKKHGPARKFSQQSWTFKSSKHPIPASSSSNSAQQPPPTSLRLRPAASFAYLTPC
jgi:hypothetical protein